MDTVGRQFSVAIVGGGIIGMSTAWRLAQAGFDVTVYEKSRIGGESSWAGAGMLAPGGEFEEDSQLARYSIASRGLYRDFVEELQNESGLTIDYQESGALDTAYSSNELRRLEERAMRQVHLGIPSKRLTPNQIATFWPHLSQERLLGGYFYPGDGAVDPRHLIAALRIICEKSGVALSEQSEVHEVRAAAAGVCVDGQPHHAVVVASGAWSGRLRVLGVPALPQSVPIKGHLIGYHQPTQVCATIVRRSHVYLLQRVGGLLIAGASEEQVGFDRSINIAAAAELANSAAELLPHLAETAPSEVWNGFRPGSDALRLGRWHSTRVYLAYGHYRNGILLAPFTAQFLVDEISANLQKR